MERTNYYSNDTPAIQPGHAVYEEQTFIANNLSAMYIPSMYAGAVPIRAAVEATPHGTPIYANPVPILYKPVKSHMIPTFANVTPSVVVISNPDNEYIELIRAQTKSMF